jgi:Kef-type K+ transport system membrane component KefB
VANDYGTPVSKRAMKAIYIGGTLGVGLLTGAAFALWSATGWDEASLPPLVAFVLGFVVSTVSIVVRVLMRRRRGR